MELRTRARIVGTGSFVPPQVLTNADLERMVDTSDEWIVSRTGISERRIANGIACSDMAVEASKRALENAGCTHEEIDLLMVATCTPDYKLPSNACVVQEKMGLPNAVAFDIVSACTGFINGLSVGNSFIQTGAYKRALLVGVEKLSAFTNYKDRNTCVLFGDGAGAAVIAPDDSGRGVISSFMKSNGRYRQMLWSKSGGSLNPITSDFTFDGSDKILMTGSDVFKIAVREMGAAATKVIADAGLETSDIALVVPHQANIRIIEALAKRIKIPMEKMYLNIEKYGNTSAASIPLALDEANRKGLIKPGDYIVMVAFGGGLIWGASLVKW